MFLSKESAPPHLNHSNEYELFGFNSVAEREREKKLVGKFGYLGLEVAEFERRRKILYAREFLDDIPYSFAHLYCFSPQERKLYTQFHWDPLFLIESGINKSEKQGDSFNGFENMQNTLSAGGDVVLWYSPADPDRKPYDSGRLYLSTNSEDGLNVNFDIKILEETFPVVDFLNSLSGKNTGDLFFYLTSPINTGLSLPDFLNILKNGHFSQKTVYVSHRLEEDPEPATPYSLKEIADGMSQELEGDNLVYQRKKIMEFKEKFQNFVYQPIGDRTIDSLIRSIEQVRWDYLSLIFDKAQKNDGVAFLYGCSASGTRVLEQNEFASSADVIFSSINSIFDTNYRNPINNFDTPTSKKSLECVTCPFCKKIVDAEISDGKISCPNCGEAAPYSPPRS